MSALQTNETIDIALPKEQSDGQRSGLHFLCEALGDISKWQSELENHEWDLWVPDFETPKGSPCSFWNSFCSSALKGVFLS
jgi:hypothetical protein